jgi:hypothetical protein
MTHRLMKSEATGEPGMNEIRTAPKKKENPKSLRQKINRKLLLGLLSLCQNQFVFFFTVHIEGS